MTAFLIIIVLYFIRKWTLLKIFWLLMENYPHLYTRHYPADVRPNFLLTIKKGGVPIQLYGMEDIKTDKEMMNWIKWNILIVFIQILMLSPIIGFVLIKLYG